MRLSHRASISQGNWPVPFPSALNQLIKIVFENDVQVALTFSTSEEGMNVYVIITRN